MHTKVANESRNMCLPDWTKDVKTQRLILRRMYSQFDFSKEETGDHDSERFLVIPHLKKFVNSYADAVSKEIALFEKFLGHNFINHTKSEVGPNLGHYLHRTREKEIEIKLAKISKLGNYAYLKAQIGTDPVYREKPVCDLKMHHGEAGLGIWEIGNFILTHLDYFKNYSGVCGIVCPGDYTSGHGRKHPYFVIGSQTIELELLPHNLVPTLPSGIATFVAK